MKRQITDDLITKISDDVMKTMMRTLALADERLPVATAGAVAAVGIMAAALQEIGSAPVGHKPDPDCVLLAALICARTGTEHPDAITQAYADLDLLKKASAV